MHAMLAKVNIHCCKNVKLEPCLAFEDNEQMACSHNQNDAGSLILVTVIHRSYIICWKIRLVLGVFGWLCGQLLLTVLKRFRT